MTTIADQVSTIICEQLGVSAEAVTPNASFVDDFGADSLAMVELVLAMEEQFDVTITDEEAQGIRTVAHAIEFIEHRIPHHEGNRVAS